MDHSYYRDKISAYSDGALEAQERELIRRHLEECAECRNLLEKLNQLSAMIEDKSGLKNDEYFENLAKRIERRIAVPEEKVVDVRSMRWSSFWWKISAAAASIVLVGTIGFYQYQDDQEMPAKVLDNLKMNREVAPVGTDSVATDEPAEFQGGRSESKGLVGKVTEGEKVLKSELPVSEPDVQEKDEPQLSSAVESPVPLESNAPVVSLSKKSEVTNDNEDKASVPQVSILSDSIYVLEEIRLTERIGTPYNRKLKEGDSLDYWRSVRDSMQDILELGQDTVQVVSKNKLKELASPAVSGLVQSSDSVKNYLQLANSWYQIGSQTQDSTERFRAVQFLNWYKNRFPADSPTVNQQLQQIPK